jgi:hypothetical protein
MKIATGVLRAMCVRSATPFKAQITDFSGERGNRNHEDA